MATLRLQWKDSNISNNINNCDFYKHFHVFKHSFYFLRTFDWFVMVYCYITVTGMKYLGDFL